MLGHLTRNFQLPEGVNSFANLRVRIRTERSNNPVKCYNAQGQLENNTGIVRLDPSGLLSTYVLKGFDYRLDLMDEFLQVTYDGVRNSTIEQGGGGGGGDSGLKSITLSEPQNMERVPWFNTRSVLRLRSAYVIIAAAYDTPSVEFNIGFGDNISSPGTELWDTDPVVANVTTGIELTNMNNKQIPADNLVWLAVKTVQGTVPSIHITLKE